ncbi:WD40 repeat-containing protein [Nitzschia inconspicua]|uniref:WD40 repeat-containing protein n=1 Tax=Nitzschia inconspicua TaxID=303405 RepID=A0A9K3KDY2_9STRA|nr:WD40 repeat-containing protein [Nitzschia inconspicua]
MMRPFRHSTAHSSSFPPPSSSSSSFSEYFLNEQNNDNDELLLQQYHPHHHSQQQQQQQQQTAILSEAWDIPSPQEMSRRIQIRQEMEQDTIQQNHQQNQQQQQAHDNHNSTTTASSSSSDSLFPPYGKGRNIVHVLNDRSVYGSRHCHLNHPPVVESRLEPTKPKPTSSSSTKAATAAATTTTSSTTTFDFPFPASNTVTKEIRTFAEYKAVTDYQSAYFTHLGAMDGYEPQEEETQEEQQVQQHQDQQQQQQVQPQQPNSTNLPGTTTSTATVRQRRTRPASSKAVSTISVAFSHDGQTQASTHGDHTVKITHCASGILLQTLHGHPRTPWTVKYHPQYHHILASGCLGHQVRIWNYKKGQCLQMIRLEFAIISLSFHPTAPILAVANGTRLHFWAYQQSLLDDEQEREHNQEQEQEQEHDDQNNNHNQNNNIINNTANQPQQQPQQSRGVLTEVEQRHMLRCVHFLPNGKSVIVGGVNPNHHHHQQQQQHLRRGGMSGGGMSFYLRLWDFDVQAALTPNQVATMANTTGLRRRAISNPRTFVPRALLYNDGGFDVSPDGLTLCACAEYWLPDGIDNVMQFQKYQEEEEEEEESEEEESEDEGGNDEELIDSPNDDYDTKEGTTMMRDVQANYAGNNPSSNQRTSIEVEDHQDSNASSPPRPPLPHPTPLSATSASSSFQGSIQHGQSSNTQYPSNQPMTPVGSSGIPPMTPPPNVTQQQFPLSPPSPPGRRFAGGLGQQNTHRQSHQHHQQQQQVVPSAPQRPTHQARVTHSGTIVPPAPPGFNRPTVNPLATPTSAGSGGLATQSGRFVPHVVTISLDTAPFLEVTTTVAAAQTSQSAGVIGLNPHPTTMLTTQTTLGIPGRGTYATSTANGGSPNNALRLQSHKLRPRLGQLLEACPLDGAKASAVTCVKFSPSTDFCLIGYGVREPVMEDPHGNQFHPVTALYRIRGGMTHVSTMLSGDDDVNIARFHPHSGYGFVYGTKQGRVRVMSPRPWNYYNC